MSKVACELPSKNGFRVQNIPKISACFLSSRLSYQPSTHLYPPPLPPYFISYLSSPCLLLLVTPTTLLRSRSFHPPLNPSFSLHSLLRSPPSNRPEILRFPALFFALLPMKHLIRRLSRVYDSSQYILLRSDSSSPASNSKSRRSKSKTLSSSSSSAAAAAAAAATAAAHVPQGHIPVYVGDEMERFVVPADFLKHPIFIALLDRSAEEYGYEQQGVLRIPCRVLFFKKVLDVLADAHEIDDVDELFRMFSEDLL